MKGYKAFRKDWTCRDFQYEIGKTYELPEGQELEICHRGFHFCENPIEVFGYYDNDADTRIAEVEALGDIQQEGTKYCTNKIKIVKEFTREQLQELIFDGNCNTGVNNSGFYNSGDYNSGSYNSGSFNSGDCNSGHRNSGDFNNGNHNSGDRNNGSRNSGNCNDGKFNSGYHNSGYFNSGKYNNGYYNSGNFNCGNHNCGDYNSGDYNSGDHNSGHHNSGTFNSGSFNSGIFNTDEPKMRSFNKMADITFMEFLGSIDYSFFDLCERISNKKLYPEDYAHIKALPNFDAKIFKKITGIDIDIEEMKEEEE